MFLICLKYTNQTASRYSLNHGRNDVLLQNKSSAKFKYHSFFVPGQETARFENDGQPAVTLEKS